MQYAHTETQYCIRMQLLERPNITRVSTIHTSTTDDPQGSQYKYGPRDGPNENNKNTSIYNTKTFYPT